jgi:hypothetical protein
MKVYRYEHPKLYTLTPYGYRCCDTEDNAHEIVGDYISHKIELVTSHISLKHSFGKFHANARYAVVGFKSGIHYCACESPKKLKNGFSGFNTRLLELGFRVAVYEVPESSVLYDKDGNQLAFVMDDADFKKYIK